MTTHTNCTHPATKAARAMCRTAAQSHRTYDEQLSLRIQDNATDSRKGMIRAEAKAKAVEAVDYSYRFETTTCDRCSGTGYRPEYAGVYGGVCFKCNKSGNNPSKGLVLTRAGLAAKKAHDAWVADHLMIPASDLRPGMKFRPNQVDGFKTVVAVSEPSTNGYSISRDDEGNEIRTPLTHIDVTTKFVTWGLNPDTSVQRAATAEERTALIARIAGLKGTIIEPKN